MTCKERRKQKQDEKAAKLSEDIISGKVIYIPYKERKKKKAKPNRKSGDMTPEEEMDSREDLVERTTKLYRVLLPGLLEKFKRIDDPRQPNKVKHKTTVLMLYGILMFVYQSGSRRDANSKLSRAIAFKNMQDIFPELETMPHADTLARFLETIDVEEIQKCLVELLKELMRNKKFKNMLVNGRYVVAVDGTQKFFRNYQWQTEALQRHVGTDKKEQYYVYILESVLIFENGLVLPVWTEILDNKDWRPEETKQDCERKAFKRMAVKLYKIFGKGKLILLGDGLYATEPVINICNKYNWEYMITVKEGCMKHVWQDAQGVIKKNLHCEKTVQWGERMQVYKWVNDIEYGSIKKPKMANIVFCIETWIENNERSSKKPEEKTTQYAWISSREITESNVFKRCTEIARKRWRIENNFHVEKHDGYEYEHCYSYNWKAMKGFHYLMKIARFVNSLVINSEIVATHVSESGISAFFQKLWLAISGAELTHAKIRAAATEKFLWRINIDNIFKVSQSSG